MSPDPGPSIAGTRLTAQAYLDATDADLEALAVSVADHLDDQVPGCPGWTGRDLVSHVVGVYRHKTVALETAAQPPDRDAAWGELGTTDPVLTLRAAYAELRDHLAGADPAVASWSWWPAEQTVGFWQRRMAQETAVHRWDAQSCAAGPDGAEVIDEAIAADGVDELLGWLTWPWDEVPQPEASGQQVAVSTPEVSWTVTLHPTQVEVRAGAAESAAAMLAGPASGLLLHLWGRPGDHGVAAVGDPDALRLLAERLAMATS
jgi:uncharacterized protein (TIGR03083 family)